MSKKCICRELGFLNPTEFYGHFIFTSLDSGEGLTLGNMIRRTLISKLSGSKIVAVKISNVNHEFSEILGVREDLLEIFLNLKEVIIKNPFNFNVCYGKLKIKGPAIITAGLIELPKDITILNPEHYLFTISEQITLNLEVKIERGKSFILATDRKLDNLGEFLPLDANFTPIIKVEYFIQPIVEFTEKSIEELHLILSTNGTLLPQEALLLAANHLSNLILSCRNIEFVGLEQKNILKNRNNLKIKSYNFDNTLKKGSNKNLEIKNTINNDITIPSNITSSFHQVSKSNKTQLKTESETYNIRTLNKNESSSIFKNKNNPNQQQTNTNFNIIETSTKPIDLRTIDIEITCLPNRIITLLRKARINMMADLVNCSSEDLQQIKGLGPVSIMRIKTQINLFFEAISL